MRPAHAQLGMTLIEMLAVLAIIGVMASATVLGMGVSSPARSVEAEARRLASRVQLAADEVMIDERPIALSGNERGYAFLIGDGDRWRNGDSDAFAHHALPDGITLDLKDGEPLPVGAEGGAPFSVTVRGKADRWTVVYDGLSVATSWSAAP